MPNAGRFLARLSLLLILAAHGLAARKPPAAADDPIAFGRRTVNEALAARRLKAAVDIRVTGSGEPESYDIAFAKTGVSIKGADPNGALYGALELAERIRRGGAAALKGAPVKGRPFLRDRGWNIFLTLPWDYVRNDTDYDPAALVDPARWWFANDGFWQTLFDQMARARLNWIDLHGTWDVSVTDAPNLYAYFIQSDLFPKVGVAPAIKAANLEKLNRIIALAHARGVRVSLMAYEASFHTPHNPAPYPENEADLAAYTREVVEKMIRQAPGLDAIGFRIGESGHGESFFSCYSDAVKASGRDIPLVTRSWLARKSRVVPLAKASRDFTVEIKFNGEQWGAPYMLMGGRMAGWFSYSFEDYLSDSAAPDAARLWEGNPVTGGGRWPAQPYKIVWQVRANGTHRILPVYDPDAVRKAIRSMPLGTASGFVVEGLETYYPKSPRYYLADPADAYVDWTHERDWMYLNLWGRLGYDPATPDEAFEAMIADVLGPAGAPLAEAWRAAGRIVMTAYSAFSLGPDHRQHAIELEWGGDTAAYIAAEPFDSQAYQSIRDALAAEAGMAEDGRIPPQETAARLLADAEIAARAAAIPAGAVSPAGQKRLRELSIACAQASRLGRYYAERFLAAWRSGQVEAGRTEAAGRASYHMSRAERAWAELAACSYYKPFTEKLRMKTNAFHWSLEWPKVKAEADRMAKIAAPVPDPLPAPAPRTGLAAPLLEIGEKTVTVAVPGVGISRAWALVKPLPSSTFFHRIPMVPHAGRFEADFPRRPWGHAVAVEAETESRMVRLPGQEAAAPYLVVPSLPGPTPLFYSSEEALTYLDPAVLSPEEHGLLLVSSRAANFHRLFNVPVQRKLLDAVRRGMTLLVLAQDYSAASRYSLAWLPAPLRVENRRRKTFEPNGILCLKKVEDPDILRQRFLPGPGWDVEADGAIAQLNLGRGRIVLVQARLLERLHIPAASAALEVLLSLGGRDKPVVVVDAGTEGGALTSSEATDFMNARDIPFLTLGEVVAAKQGIGANQPIPAKLDDDALLSAAGLRAETMVDVFLEKKVQAASALAAPASRAAFEARRAAVRPRLMKSLGLDPLPKRTPLKARVTGILQRHGFRIEKVVFESRPGFPVTAHLYVPDGASGRKLPVIVNPHGHWGYKKNEPTVQSRLIGQALNGYLAMVIDSPGFSFEGDLPVERRFAGTHDDLRLILGSQNATSVYVWDLMRALDYLATRPEADMTRVGLTGCSGGGLATLWAFAAEPRFTCAASVVYASSMEINPNNGCLCNHVPGALDLGDRADVLALRAPAPILIIGAEEDVEFPAKGMRLSDEKLKKLWGLFGRSEDAWLRMFPGGHDYSRPMRETVLGFFDKYLRNVGDGAPVPEPEHVTTPPDSPELFVLAEPPAKPLTMRDIARNMFKRAPANKSMAAYIRWNGGLPPAVPLETTILDESNGKIRAVFTSEPGLTIPVVFWRAEGAVKAFVVLVGENGKAAAVDDLHVGPLLKAGVSCLAIDPRGLGEVRTMELRYTTYLGRAPAFGMGWDIARAIAAFVPEGVKVAVVGRGPTAGQAAMAAALIEPRIGFTAGLSTLKEYADAFRSDVPLLAVQPRANYVPPLKALRSAIPGRAVWSFLGEPEPDWLNALLDWAGR
ncbi:MAG: dienelactone hydrolase family protein [Acidobacteriota bacterium]|nr:dienelactone hydrolase family protein [Acidobacteriota bacterium]